jgi:hypothetical protein
MKPAIYAVPIFLCLAVGILPRNAKASDAINHDTYVLHDTGLTAYSQFDSLDSTGCISTRSYVNAYTLNGILTSRIVGVLRLDYDTPFFSIVLESTDVCLGVPTRRIDAWGTLPTADFQINQMVSAHLRRSLLVHDEIGGTMVPLVIDLTWTGTGAPATDTVVRETDGTLFSLIGPAQVRSASVKGSISDGINEYAQHNLYSILARTRDAAVYSRVTP